MTDIEMFRLVAAEFAGVPDETVNGWLELTRPMVSKKQFGKLYQQGVVLLAAHRMKMSGNFEAADEVSGGNGVNVGSIADSLRVASYSEGDSSISFNSSASATERDAEYALTIYGTQYLSLRCAIVVPIHCSGEVT